MTVETIKESLYFMTNTWLLVPLVLVSVTAGYWLQAIFSKRGLAERWYTFVGVAALAAFPLARYLVAMDLRPFCFVPMAFCIGTLGYLIRNGSRRSRARCSKGQCDRCRCSQ